MEIRKYLVHFFSYIHILDVFAAIVLISFQQIFIITSTISQFAMLVIAAIFTFISDIIRKSDNFLLRWIRFLAILYIIVSIAMGIKSINSKEETLTIPLTSCSFSGIDCVFYRFQGTKCKSYYELTKYGKNPDDITNNYDVEITFKHLSANIYRNINVALVPKKTKSDQK